MYRANQSLLQYQRNPADAASPSKLQMGLRDRIQLARGSGATAAVAAKLAKSGISTPWTVAPKGVREAHAKVTRAAASAFTRGASEISSGIGKAARKLKFW